MRKSTNNAFTLVELIVVITILAVLGTIAFISLQGYSADARNSKRTSDINNIQSAMGIKQAEGGSLKAFVVADANTKVTGANYGGTGTILDTDYFAGKLNYTALGIKADEFKDPNDQEYKIAMTTTGKGRFELAASLEDGATKIALVKGTYSARTATGYTIDSVSGKIITLKGEATNAFSKGDYIDILTGTTVTTDAVKVIKVGRDGITLTMSNDVASGVDKVILNTSAAATDTVTPAIATAANETGGLIAIKNTAGGDATAVTNGDTDSNNQPY